jgi:hypothetical protein
MPEEQVVDPQAEEPEGSAALVEETSTTESESATDEPQEKSKGGGFQKRIDKLTKEKAEKEREAEFWRQEAMRNRPKEEPKVEAQKEPERPKREEYANEEDFLDKLTDWKLDQRQAEQEKKRKADEAVRPLFEARVRFAEATPDFHEVVRAATNVPVSEYMQPYLADPEVGPELSYFLAKNPEEGQKLAKLGPVALAQSIIDLRPQYKPEEQEEAPVAKTTAAPKPPSPVGTRSKETEIDPYNETDFRKFDEWYRKQNFKK